MSSVRGGRDAPTGRPYLAAHRPSRGFQRHGLAFTAAALSGNTRGWGSPSAGYSVPDPDDVPEADLLPPRRPRRAGGEAGADPRSRARRITLACAGLVGAIVLVAVAWVLVTGLLARAQLGHVRRELPQLRKALAAGDVAEARSISADLAKRAHRAHGLTTGPAWAIGAKIPGIGAPLRTGRTIATASDDIGHQVVPEPARSRRHADQLGAAARLGHRPAPDRQR